MNDFQHFSVSRQFFIWWKTPHYLSKKILILIFKAIKPIGAKLFLKIKIFNFYLQNNFAPKKSFNRRFLSVAKKSA